MKTTLQQKLGVAAVLVLGLGLFGFQALFWSRDYAMSRALQRVSEACVRDGRDLELLVGPREGTIGNRPWSFEWVYQGQPRHLYGVWFSRSGNAELYGGDPDDPESAAYESR